MKITIRKTTIEEVILDLPFCTELSVQNAMEVAEAYDPSHFTQHDEKKVIEGKWVAIRVNTQE